MEAEKHMVSFKVGQYQYLSPKYPEVKDTLVVLLTRLLRAKLQTTFNKKNEISVFVCVCVRECVCATLFMNHNIKYVDKHPYI